VTARFLVVAALGLALTFYLVTYAGLDAVLTAASAVGWRGFAVICAYALAMFLPLGMAWYVLIPEHPPLRDARVFIWSRMVRDAAAEALPFSQLGGIAIGARAAILHGVPSVLAVGSMIVDVTTEMLAQIAYIVLGLLILFARVTDTSRAQSLTPALVIGLVLLSIGGGLFVALQRYGHHWVARKLAPRLFSGAEAATAAVASALDQIYRSRVRIGLSLALHFFSWVTSAIGTWIALRLMGSQVDVAPVIAIESLVYAVRSAGFVVPNAFGVQEAAYVLFAPLFGVEVGLGLAVSLLKRGRDYAIGIPIVAIWQVVESQRALAGKPSRDHR
jgi:glycosyltransferase 2 family protein